MLQRATSERFAQQTTSALSQLRKQYEFFALEHLLEFRSVPLRSPSAMTPALCPWQLADRGKPAGVEVSQLSFPAIAISVTVGGVL
jgi:hypothetical protein